MFTKILIGIPYKLILLFHTHIHPKFNTYFSHSYNDIISNHFTHNKTVSNLYNNDTQMITDFLFLIEFPENISSLTQAPMYLFGQLRRSTSTCSTTTRNLNGVIFNYMHIMVPEL